MGQHAQKGEQNVVVAMTARIDAHVHVWSGDEAAYPFSPHDGLAAPKEIFDADRLVAAMDPAGVSQALAIQPRVYGYDHAYLFAASASLGQRLRIVPLLNAVRSSNVDEMQAFLGRDDLAGFRVIALGSERADWLNGPQATRLWRSLAEAGLPLGLLITAIQLPVVEILAEREPSLPIVVDHLGGIGADDWPEYGPVLLGLSCLPRVHVKLSAFGHLSRDCYPYEDLRKPVRQLLDSFGPARLLWGSDWPHVYEFGSYQDSADSAADAIGIEHPAERELIFGGTARALYGFGT